MKICCHCQELKPLESFYRDKSHADGHDSPCKACSSLAAKVWQKANPEKVRATKKAWQKAHIEEYRAGSRKWRKANPEKHRAATRMWCETNPERVRAAKRKWAEKNPGKINAKARKRKAAKLRAVPKWSERELIKIVYEKASDMGFEVDHIVPLQSKAVCGLHVWSNLQLLSQSENSKKKNYHWPDMWEQRA